jgi:hypothetical protein
VTCRLIHLAAIGVVCGVALASAGCKSARLGGSTPPDRVIDELRQENVQLQREVARLNRQIEARLAELEAARAERGVTAPAESVPRLESIALGGLSGFVPASADARACIRLYVVTRDQHGRTLPVEGVAVVQAVRIEPDAEPVTVAQHTWDADAFRAAYRSGFAGTHYTLELPVPDDAAGELTVKVTVTDAATAAAFSAQRVVKVEPRPSSSQ